MDPFMKIQFPVTLLTLLLACFALAQTRQIAWIVPVLLANSVVGFLYMLREQESIAAIGIGFLGYRIRRSMPWSLLTNVASHVLAPYWILRTVDWTVTHPLDYTVFLEVLGLLLLDVEGTYPSRHGMAAYVVGHILLTVVFAVLIKVCGSELGGWKGER